MRYNLATESTVRTLDTMAAESRAWLLAAAAQVPEPEPEPPSTRSWTWTADDVYAAGACQTWICCHEMGHDPKFKAEMQQKLARDMHRAMHHQPHQPEY